MRRRRWFGFLVSGLLLIGATGAQAAPLDPKKVPAPLAPWVPWVLRGHESALCPALGEAAGDGVCVWSGRLTLALDGKGGKFSQECEVLAPSAVRLPGNHQRWPIEVKANGKPVPVIDND